MDESEMSENETPPPPSSKFLILIFVMFLKCHVDIPFHQLMFLISDYCVIQRANESFSFTGERGWKKIDKKNIFNHLLPICRQTNRPPTKEHIDTLKKTHPELGNHNWRAIKTVVYSRFRQEEQQRRRTSEAVMFQSGRYSQTHHNILPV